MFQITRTTAAALIASVVAVPAFPAEKPGAADQKSEIKKTPGRIAWGTTNDAALMAISEALQLLESLAPGARYREPAQKAATADPNFAFAHYLVGAGSPGGEAKPHLDKAVELSAKAPDGERRYIEAAMLQRARKTDEAIAAFEKLKADYPDEPLVLISLGQNYLQKGQVEKARQTLEAAVKQAPMSARALVTLGNTLLLTGDYAAARDRFSAARDKMVPGVPPQGARYGMAQAYLYEGKPAEAEKILEKYLTEYRESPTPPWATTAFPEVFIYNTLARVQLESGKADAALASYEKGFEAVKTSSLGERDKKIWLGRLHHGRGRSLARLGKHKEAWVEAEVVKKMIDEGGEDGKQFLPAWHYLAGYLKLEAGETDAAIEHLQQADADDPFHRLLLARAYEKAGQKEKARATYQEIVDYKQNNIERALAYPEARKKLL